MRAGLRARQLVNLANGSTLAGLGVAAAGTATDQTVLQTFNRSESGRIGVSV